MIQLNDETGKFIETLKNEIWDGRKPNSLFHRIKKLLNTTLVKVKGPYTSHENEIVDRAVSSYRKVILQYPILTRLNP